jgi:ferredoxin
MLTERKGALDLQVWIDQDLCIGNGQCEEIGPALFTGLDDGLAHVKRPGVSKGHFRGSASMTGDALKLCQLALNLDSRFWFE